MTFKDLNLLGAKREPFLFITDFKAQKLEVILLDELDKYDIEFKIDESYIFNEHENRVEKIAPLFDGYKEKFNKIIEKIKAGETYLLNLTQPTKIKSHLNLKEMYTRANAPYKLRFKDKFVCFSPETFIKIKDNVINTYPMKGTINAAIDNAQEKILNDKKEMAEHIMVVDLLRNDLSIVARNVKVENFRYITKIEAGEKKLLQVSSHISGNLGNNWHERIGDILKELLPAGSISGAPKKSTLKIINDVEEYERGFYTGVFGLFDGEKLDSGVMIRFIEKVEDGYIYKSGGGITLDSNVKDEYNELLDKVYLP